MLVNSNMMTDVWPRFEAAFWLHILSFFAFHTFLTISYYCFCRADSYPLMTSIWPTAFACIAYVYFCKVPSMLFPNEAFSLLSASTRLMYCQNKNLHCTCFMFHDSIRLARCLDQGIFRQITFQADNFLLSNVNHFVSSQD